MAAQGSDADRRTDVLAATVQLVIDRGTNAIRLADVADAAGVSIGLISHHFRSREGLLAAAFRYESERIVNTQPPPDTSRPALERLVRHVWLRTPAGSSAAATAFPVWSFWLDFWALASHQPEVHEQFGPIYETVSMPLREALTDGIAAGEFAPRGRPKDLACRITALIDGIALRTLLGDIESDHMLKLLVDGLCLELELREPERRRAHRIARKLSAA
jgi:AcrR family transcriptional regulator